MYKIIYIYGNYHAQIGSDNKPDKYGEPKLFRTCYEADMWISRHSYLGMTHRYIIKKVG